MRNFGKSSRSEKARLTRLLANQSAKVRAAVNTYVGMLTSEGMIRRVADTLQSQGSAAALDFIDQHVVSIADSINSGFAGFGAREIGNLSSLIGGATVGISFDPASPRASAFMEQNKLEFVTNFTRTQRDVTRQALQSALDSGAGVRDAARAFRDSIGLTTTQWDVVNNYRSLLEAGNADALDRALRDRRFDPTVDRAIQNDEPLTTEQIDRMVERYRDRFLALRAETIARTETIKVLNVARQEATDQVVEDTGIDPGTVTRTWMATLDARTRDTHAEMDGQTVGLDEPFVSPSGAVLMFPGDPDAPAEEVINCLLLGEEVQPDWAMVATTSGFFDGEAVTIETTNGRKASVTANHPILTINGWKPAKLLNQRDYLVCYKGLDRFVLRSNVDANHVPTRIENVHKAGALFARAVIPGPMNFHGDVVEGQVEVVTQAGGLLLYLVSSLLQRTSKAEFHSRGMRHQLMSGLGTCLTPVERVLLATAPHVSCNSLSTSLFGSALLVFDKFCLALSAWPHTRTYQGVPDLGAAGLERFRQRIFRLPGEVTLDQVTRVRTFPFRGHVYSPQTTTGTYALANGIVNHNCRCVVAINIE